MWEAGARSLAEGWRQAQEFWTTAARSWGDLAGVWMQQFPQARPGSPDESMAVWRELQEAAFAVAQAWMRLPMLLATGGQPTELQAAISQLTQAQGRAYKLWMDAMSSGPGAARPQRTAAPDQS